MIKLSGQIKHNISGKQPFVIKVNRNADIRESKETGTLKKINNETLIECNFGTIALVDKNISIEDNEVVIIFPKVSILKRFFRPQANTNTILLTEECDQKCIMCSQPPKNKRYDHFELYKQALSLLPKNAFMCISGGEPTLLKKPLFAFLKEIIQVRPDLMFHILSNAQHFTKDDRDSLFQISNNVTWGIPLYSHIEKSHDDIVSKDGAYRRLFENFNHLLSSGSRVELRTVLMRQNINDLQELSELISGHLSWIEVWAIMQLENIGYARMNWNKIFFDHSINFSKIEQALIIALSRNINISLYNFPYCTVPAYHRKIAKVSISDWKGHHHFILRVKTTP